MKAICILGVSCVLVAFAAPAAVAQSTQRIGEVASLRKEAARSGKPVRLGDGVFQNEVITTGADSSVRLTFIDQTNLAIGPTSRVTLDRFVFNPASGEMAVSLTRGAFRFTSGNLDKRAYRIETPTATMGVRGTIINIDIGPNGASTFTSFEGSANVCSKITGQCLDIEPGQSVTVDSRGAISRTSTQFTFQDYCARNATLCEGIVRRAGVLPTTTPNLVFLGVGAVFSAGVIATITNNDNNNNRPLSP